MRVSVVMPAHNEEDLLAGSVGAVVDALAQRGRPAEVLVVENGSTDRTAQVAKQLEADRPEVRVLSRPVADYGVALRAGFLEATGDIVVNFDVDYVDFGFFDRAVAAIEAHGGPDVVVGSKRSPGADDARGMGRRLVTAVFATVLRLGFGLSVSDTHGLKALRRAALVPLVEACRFGTDLFDTELVLRAERAGLAVTEVPVVVRELRPSRTPIVRRIPRTLVGLARLRRALKPNRRARAA